MSETKEFIVAYNSTSCTIELASDEEFYTDKRYSLKWQYDYARRRWIETYKYGDVVPYNNQFWCAVQAHNAKEALDLTLRKLAGETSYAESYIKELPKDSEYYASHADRIRNTVKNFGKRIRKWSQTYL